MIFTDQMKNLKIYRKPMFLPVVDDDKKKKSAIMLLTPNYESSKRLMNHPMTINRLRFQSYYMEQDVTFLINGSNSKIVTREGYIIESNYHDLYQNLNEMSAREKARLSSSDFGLPEQRKYPMPDEDHVKSAIRFFNYVDKKDEEELATNILRKIEEYNMKNLNVGDNNRFKKYFVEFVAESTFSKSFIKSIEDALAKEGIKVHVSTDADWGLENFDNGKCDSLCLGSFKKEEYNKAYSIIKDTLPSGYSVSKDNYFTLFIKRKGVLKESFDLLDESCSLNIENSIDTAIESVSAIITNKRGEILLLDHKKCGALNLPGGKLDPGEAYHEAIIREIREELGIKVTTLNSFCDNVFVCEYPAGSGKYLYFKDRTFIINTYEGTIVNNEPEKHNSIEWMDRNELCNNIGKYNCSQLLRSYLANWSRELNDLSDTLVDSLSSFIYFSGYQNDIEIARKIITPQVYYNILSKKLQLPILKFEDIPIIKLIIGDNNDHIQYDNQDGHLVIEISVKRYEMGKLEDYILSVYDSIYAGIIKGVYPCTRDTVLPTILAHYLTGLDTKYGTWGKYLFMDNLLSIREFNSLCSVGDTKSIFTLIVKEFPNVTERELNTPVTNNTGYTYDKGSIIDSRRLETMTTSEVEESFSITESYLEESEENFRAGNLFGIIQEDTKSNPQLKRVIYDERIKQRSDMLAYLKKVKEDNSFIKYAFPDLEKYGQKNIFVDLSFYNEIFFRNSVWRMQKGFNLYLDMVSRLINNPKFASAGYEKKTIFIPVLDWDRNRATKMWLYKEDINPISIIYELMRTNSSKVKEVFGSSDIIFFGKNEYFKLNFSQIEDMSKAYNKFRMFVSNIRDSKEFDTEDIDTSFDTKEDPRVIKTNLIDKIEDAKGVDLTGKANPEAFVKEPTVPGKRPVKKEKPEPKKIDTSNLTKSADVEVEKKKEEDIERLANMIDMVANNSTDTEDALDMMDRDIELKRMLLDIESIDSDKVKIDPARAARMSNLDNEFLQSEIAGKSIREILDPNSSNRELKKTELNIASPNQEWKNMTYMNFDRDYNLQKDIIACFYHFTKVSKPIAIRKLDITDNSTSEDRLDLYTVEMEDFNGKRFTVKLDVPRMQDNRFLLRGNEKSIQTQLFNMPIIKTELDTCQIVTNYQKIFIRRFNTVTGRSNPYAAKLLKAFEKYNGKSVKVSYSNNSKVCNKYELPIDYIDLASVLNKIETDEVIIYFNQDEIRELYSDMIDEKNGIPVGYGKKDKEILYFNMNEYQLFTNAIVNRYLFDCRDFIDVYTSIKTPGSKGTYSRCSILNTEIPLILVCAYVEGLTTVLKKAHIPFYVNEKIPPELKQNPGFNHIKFNDGYLTYEMGYASCMLLNGLADCNTDLYSIMDIDNKSIYEDMLDEFGGKIKADGLDNFYDCLVDPITKECLEYYKLPTDFVNILLYANLLLCDNKFIRHTDSSSRRIRRTELIAAYAYEAISEAYALYANQVKHGKNGVALTMKQSAVIDKLLLSPVSSDDSILNALNAVETTNSITFKGKAGLNNDRSYSLDKRTYDESMLNVLGMSTGFSANIGVTRQATVDMNIEGTRGYIKPIDSNVDKLNSAKSLCATEALTPFGCVRDDAPRTYMTFIQTSKHMVRTEDSDPLLVTNGSDEAMAYLTIDKFAYKAKEDGKVIEITPDYIIVEYKSGNRDFINLKETVEKNSDGGFYVPLKLDKVKGLKVGDRIKDGQVLAYDKKSFSNSVGESDNLAYNIGKLAKVAIINTDEGFEDSGICSEDLSKLLATKVIKKVDHTIDKAATIFKMAKIGDMVEVEDNLLVWQNPHEEEEANVLLNILANDQETVSELGRKVIKSDVSGRIADIKIYRTVELDELSDSLRKIVEEYEKPIKELKGTLDKNGINSKNLPATYKLEATGKLKKAQEAVFIEFYLEYTDTIAVGDKITYYSANKAIIKNIIPKNLTPYTDFRPNEPVHAFVSETSISNRMVTSTMVYGSIQKLLVELDRKIKGMLGIKFDDTTV